MDTEKIRIYTTIKNTIEFDIDKLQSELKRKLVSLELIKNAIENIKKI